MAVDPGFGSFILEQLGRVAPSVRSRAMFGGLSFRTAEGTFALLDDEQLYLKGDKLSVARYESAGWPAFRPFGEDGAAMNYFAVPGELLEDLEGLRPWVDLAREAAARAPKKKR